MSGVSSGIFYVVDIDHIGDMSKTHPISIESLKSIYLNIGESIEFISPVIKFTINKLTVSLFIL